MMAAADDLMLTMPIAQLSAQIIGMQSLVRGLSDDEIEAEIARIEEHSSLWAMATRWRPEAIAIAMLEHEQQRRGGA